MDRPTRKRSNVSLSLRHAAICALSVALAILFTGDAFAQRGQRSAPVEGYFTGFAPFYDGDFKSAHRVFRDAGRSGIASTEGRWIDSICYHTMLGECYYQMGDMTSALNEYNSAVKMYLAHRDWMVRIDFSGQEVSAEQNNNTNITWGSSSRKTTIGHFLDRYPSMQGRLDNERVIRQGGVVAPPQLYPVHVSEIVRCTALAMSRRREILGPVCEHDPLTGQLVDALSRRPGQPNHWSQCWIELQLGLAYASANKMPQAISELQKSLLCGGQYDHPLTCLALLELGKLALEQGKHDAAATFFHEATISAAFFDRYDVMEEGFRLGALTHIVSGQKGVYPPLAPAAAWARRLPMLQTSILVSLAENQGTAGDLSSASKTIGEANRAISRGEMEQGAIGARLNYQTARVALQSGNTKQGGPALNAAMTYQKAASKRLFQIGFTDSLFVGGDVTERVADVLFEEVLREPTRLDWLMDPMETLTVGTTPNLPAYEHWFELALARKEQEKALNIADRIRRRRFYATQPLGGRILALRWVLEAPEETLSKEAQLQRQELLAKYPKYEELSKQAAALTADLRSLPLAPDADADKKKQASLLADLGKVSATQEVTLQLMSLERVPAEYAFPPLVGTKELQAKLPDGTLVLIYLATQRNVHAFAMSKDRYGHFLVSQPGKVKTDVADMLKLMGHNDRTQPVNADALASDEWKTPAKRLLTQLTNDMKPEDWAKYKEVVIVPDGVLWYLPFEALPVAAADGEQTLLSQVLVRYSPTLSLAIPDSRPTQRIARTAIVAGKLYPREDESLTEAAAEQMAAIDNVTLLSPDNAATSGVRGAAFDRFLLMAEVEDPDRLPYNWSPLKLDAGKPGSTLADWALLPWSGPQQVVFPGFHTPAEYALKKGGTGEEVFLTVCGLMAGGSRTIMLSRWRVGGRSTLNLMREFVQELPHEPAPVAWRRSVQLAAASPIDPAGEPRLKASGAAPELKADHPFFWSGYLLVDTGAAPVSETPKKPEEEQAAAN